jgi:hypothetical protein
VDAAGYVYVADTVNSKIRKITPLGNVSTLGSGFTGPAGLAVDGPGNVFVADSGNCAIRKISSLGVVTTLAGLVGSCGYSDGNGGAARFYNPIGIALDALGNVHVTENVDNRIRKVTPAGDVTTTVWAGNGSGGSEDGTDHAAHFGNPEGIAVDPSGNLIVADTSNHSIRIGRTALADVATIDSPAGAVGAPRQLGTSPQTATSWNWEVIRRPSNSAAVLSSTSIRTPTFTPDVADLYVFRLVASDGTKTSITLVSLTATATASAVVPAGLVEDAHATGSTFSNVNNIIEPGETFLVNASWKNIGASPLALTGAASAFTGPGGATYSILDSAANYGTIASGATSDSFSAGGPSFRFSVSNPAARPAAHWDATFLETLSTGDTKTWTLHVGNSFSDVPVGDVSYPYVETLFHNGITNGCAPGLFCYPDILPRWQAAILLARTMLGGGTSVPTSGTVGGVGPYNCSSGGTSLFSDVLPTDVGCPHIHYIYSQQVTTGCAPGLFCPGQLMPRWQAAVFLSRAMLGPGIPVPTSGTVPSVGTYNCTSGGNSLFGDVLPTDVGCSYIHYIYSQGVTQGYGNGNFGPDDLLPRWQMAILLVKAFHIPFLF